MANVFKQSSEKINDSPFVVLIFLVFVVLFLIGCGLSIEDYSTSYYGYQRLPTQKVNDWVIPLVAALPQLGQIGFLYVFASDTNKRWGALIAVLLHFADVTTDVAFKVGKDISPQMLFLAIAETEILYTIGSEILLTVSFGMVLALFPRVLAVLGLPLRAIMASPQSAPPASTVAFPRAQVDAARSPEEKRRIVEKWRSAREEGE